MPTGYTAPLYDGEETDFEEFILRCSRGWGAAILLRDSDPDVLPTEENVVEGDYNARALVKAQVEYDRVRDLTLDQIGEEHQAELEQRARSDARTIARCEEIRERYEAMLARVEEWEPPSEDHVGFKEFVVKQISESIDFDTKPYTRPLETLTDSAWQAARLERLGNEIERQREEIRKQAERDTARQRWVRELRESLGCIPA